MKKVTHRGGCSPKKYTVERMLKWYIHHKLEVIRFYKMTKYDSTCTGSNGNFDVTEETG